LITDYPTEFNKLHNSILDSLHYKNVMDYIIRFWPIHKKKELLSDMLESMIKDKK